MFPRFRPKLSVLVFYSVVVTAAFLLVLVRLPYRSDFTAADARAEEGRLLELVHATRVVAPGHDGPVHVTWSPVPGGFRGLALLPQWRQQIADAGPEGHLAVWLTIDETALVRNPARTALPAATLVRRSWTSDLVDPGDPRRLTLTLMLAAGGFQSVASVDNVLDPDGTASSSSVGRLWGRLAGRRASRSEEWDFQALAVLERVVRARICDDPAVWSSCQATALTIGRSARPRTYTITLRPLSGTRREALPFELEVATDGPRLLSGTLTPLSRATLSRPADLFVLPPRSQLEVVTPEDPGLVVAGYRPGNPGWTKKQWTIDFRTLLQGTEW